jgi:hypothetical protein
MKCPERSERGGTIDAGAVFLSFVVVSILITSAARATSVSLPLGGYYHPGRYIPVRFDVETESSFTISADGAVTTTAEYGGHGVVPFLVERSTTASAHWTTRYGSGDLPLHPLQADQLLVGSLGPAASLAGAIFPDRQTISVQLDPFDAADPFVPVENFIVWASLDLVLIQQPQLAWFDDNRRAILLAGGTSLVVAGESGSPPDTRWPWEHVGSCWLLRSPPPLAVAIADTDDTYAPTFAWQPGRSASYRTHVALLGLIFAIGAAGSTLWRSKWSIAALAGWSLLAIAGFRAWDNGQEPLATAGGDLRVVYSSQPQLIRQDHWTYQRSARSTAVVRPLHPSTDSILLPVLPRHGGPATVTLVCGSFGAPDRFITRLDPDRTMAWVERRVAINHASTQAAAATPVTSPLRQLLPMMYPRCSIVAERRSPHGWPDIDVEARP